MKTNKKRNIGSIIGGIVMLLVLLLLRELIDRATFLWLTLAITLMASAVTGVLARRYRKTKKESFVNAAFSMIALFSFFMWLSVAMEYTYDKILPFWGVSLVFAIVLTLAVGSVKYFLKKQEEEAVGNGERYSQSDGEKTEVFEETEDGEEDGLTGDGEAPSAKSGNDRQRMAVLFITVFVMAFLALNSILMHLNFLLDDTPPKEIRTVVVDKRKVNRTKGGDSYYLTVKLGNETLELSVSASEYGAYDEGDPYTVLSYNGAFDTPFYLPSDEE
ncbi:MAG: hypothetical protein IJW46_08305 [Clostridia bacterium]|nr:hypothetical protein [Clostridia bacterium]